MKQVKCTLNPYILYGYVFYACWLYMYTHTSLFANAACFTNCGFVATMLSVNVHHILEKNYFTIKVCTVYIYILYRLFFLTLTSAWCIFCSQRWRSCIQSAKTRPGADCGSDHELLIAKFRLKFNKVGKPTKPFRCDLNQTPYDYTVEVKNRFKRLALIECLMNYGQRFMTSYRRQQWRPSARKRNAKRQNDCLRRPYK